MNNTEIINGSTTAQAGDPVQPLSYGVHVVKRDDKFFVEWVNPDGTTESHEAEATTLAGAEYEARCVAENLVGIFGSQTEVRGEEPQAPKRQSKKRRPRLSSDTTPSESAPAGPPEESKPGKDQVTQHGESAPVGTNASPPASQPSAKADDRSPEYRYWADGIFLVHHSGKDGDERLEQLGNFKVNSIYPIVEDNGVETRCFYEIVGYMDGQKFGPRKLTVPEFEEMHWIGKLFGPKAVIYPGSFHEQHVRTAIQLHAIKHPERILYTSTGRHLIGGKWLFLHAAGAIGEAGAISGIRAELPPRLKSFSFPSPPEGEDRTKAIRASLDLLNVAEDRITIPLLAAVYRAPLGSASHSIHLGGVTGAMKTTLATLAEQHFGADFTSENLPASWGSTAQYNQEVLFTAKDMLVVVDDFNPRGSEAEIKQYHRAADTLFRSAANRAGRGRNRPDGTPQVPHEPRALALSTGEEIPTGSSLNARVVNVPIGKDSVNRERLNECQRDAAQGLYAMSMSGYLRWLAPRYASLESHVAQRTRQIQMDLHTTGQHLRVAENLASLGVGWEMFLEFAVECQAISRDQRDVLWARRWAALEALGREQHGIQAIENIALEAAKLLASADVAGRIWFRKPDDPDPDYLATPEVDSPNNMRRAQVWVGWRKDGNSEWLCEPNALFAALTQLFRDQGRALPWTKATLWKRMREGGLIMPGEKNHHTVRRSLGGRQRYVVCVPPETFTQIEGKAEPERREEAKVQKAELKDQSPS